MDFFFAAQSSFPPSPDTSPDVQLATLAQRVKEVLPHVPLVVIQRDLGMGKGSLTQEDKQREEKWVVRGKASSETDLLSSLFSSQDWLRRLDHHHSYDSGALTIGKPPWLRGHCSLSLCLLQLVLVK